MTFSACVRASIRQAAANLDCGSLIAGEIDATLGTARTR